ncbi:MAG: phosphonate metabolism transcriptional regulator PhnF [Neomegalonema sp.]|nr:phosphonate metabolism transcriptional regulator PhnF [Neomegalonema sp.]
MARTPVWKHIYETLRSEIVDGSFNAGDKLPTEKEFSERFDVNRHTVRRALSELSQAGIISVRRGSGAYVSDGILDYKIGPRTRFSQNVLDLGRIPSQKMLRSELVAADARVADRLGVRPGRPVILIESVGEADGTPVCFAEQNFPADRFPDFAGIYERTGSITETFKHYGVIDYLRAWTRIAAIAPSRTIAKKLRQPDNAPVLRAEALNLDMAGQAIEYAQTFFAGQRAALMIENTNSPFSQPQSEARSTQDPRSPEQGKARDGLPGASPVSSKLQPR